MQRVGLVHDLIGELSRRRSTLVVAARRSDTRTSTASATVVDRDQLERRWRQLLEGRLMPLTPQERLQQWRAVERRQMILREP
jgi:TolB-like protein